MEPPKLKATMCWRVPQADLRCSKRSFVCLVSVWVYFYFLVHTSLDTNQWQLTTVIPTDTIVTYSNWIIEKLKRACANCSLIFIQKSSYAFTFFWYLFTKINTHSCVNGSMIQFDFTLIQRHRSIKLFKNVWFNKN